jgi:K+ transporter
MSFFLTVDLVFFSASMLKIVEGGWFPLGVGVVYTRMSTWRKGRTLLYNGCSPAGRFGFSNLLILLYQ